MRVLIIDDSRVFHSYIKALLEDHFSHLDLLFCTSGEEGLLVYEENRPEIILLDIFMPGMDGLEVLQRLRRMDPYVQIIIISMSHREELLEEAFALGANDYIVKGPRPREMAARIRRAFESQKEIADRKEMECSLQTAAENIHRVNETFLLFGSDHDANIQRIVETAATLSRADYAFYNEIMGNRLCIRQAYNAPPGLEREDDAEGHICTHVVEKGLIEPTIIRDVKNSPFAETDPGVRALGINSYLGFPVQVKGELVGVLCTLFTRMVTPSEGLLEPLSTLARGLGVEVERKKTMESLHRFRQALDSSADAIFLMDYQTMRFIDVNQEACDSLGYTREELLSMGPHHIKPLYDQHQLQRVFERLIKGEERDGVIETIHQRKDGGCFPVEVFIRWYKAQKKDLLIASVRDITERKKAEEEIQQRVEFEALITSLATYFINLSVEKIDEGILQGLKQICNFTFFDSCDIYLLSEDGKSAARSHRWHPQDTAASPETLNMLEDLPVVGRELQKRTAISIPFVSHLPSKMQVEKERFLTEGLSSLILVPLYSGENLLGFLKFNNYQEEKIQCHDTIPLFQITGTMFVNALERKKAEMNLQNELEKARELKESLFSTTLPSVQGVEVSGILRQASHVGGDYYNCYPVGEDLLFLLVDVTGHGLDAALITVFVSTFFRRELVNWSTAPDPLAVLNMLSHDFKQQGFPDDYFLEVFLGVFSPATMGFRYAVAGAIRSLIFHPTMPSRDLPSNSGSLVHNLINTPRFGGGHIQLEQGEGLLLYTDGVDELLMAKDYQVGEGFMRRRIKTLFGLLPAQDLLERAVDDALFLLKRRQPPDDMSILGLFSYKGRQQQQYKMPRQLKAVGVTITKILDDLTAISIDPHLVQMALHEALINAVLYSTGKMEIQILVAVDAYHLIIVVDDGGTGFDWRRVMDKRQEFLAPREGGRGLALMERAADTIAYNSGGNRLALGWDIGEGSGDLDGSTLC